MVQTNAPVESLMGTLRLGEVHWERAVDPTSLSRSGLGRTTSDKSSIEAAVARECKSIPLRKEKMQLLNSSLPHNSALSSSSLSGCSSISQLGQRSAEGPRSSTPRRHPAASPQADQDQASPAISLQKRPSTHTYPKFTQPDYSIWSSTKHSGWFDDSLLSGIFHPAASGPRGSPSDVADGTRPLFLELGIL